MVHGKSDIKVVV